MQRVPLRRAHQRERDAGAAAGVLSTAAPPGQSRPSASAASIIATAIRSFMLPVGFSLSKLSTIRAPHRGTTGHSSSSDVAARGLGPMARLIQ